MNDALVPYRGQLPESREESISRQFYDWERRGRGWKVYDFPVELEPPFRPFFFVEPPEKPVIDDGRVPTLLSRLFGNSSQNRNSSPANLEAGVSRYEAELAELDEPECCQYQYDDFEEIRLVLPKDGKLIAAASERLLLSLAYAAFPISFEIIGNAENIVVQFAATDHDLQLLQTQLQAHFPECLLLRPKNETGSDYLVANWTNSGEESRIVDFGLSEEFFLPLQTSTSFGADPLVALIGALSNLQNDEIGILQILFQKTKNDWSKEVTETIGLFDKTGFFDYLPDLKSLFRQKLSSPLFAVLIRVAAKSSWRGRSMQIIRSMAGGLAQLARPSSNELIPLANDDYDSNYHEQALLNRQSFRCGMLLNADELVSLAHPPSPVVRTEKLLREAGQTKAVPAMALGHPLILGENCHQEKAQTVTLSNEQRTRHVHVIGSSGSGKSTLLLNLIKQDLERGQGLCVIDPHGDLVDEVVANIPESRIPDTILFDPSDADWPIGFNILQAKSDLEKIILSSDLVATFRRMSTSWGDVMDTVLANAVLAFIESDRGGTLFELKRFLVENNFREEFLTSVTDDSIRYFWTHEFPLIANKPQASILIRLDTFLRQKLIRNSVCQKDSKIDFRQIMDNKKILLIKLSQGLIGEENAYLLGTLLVSRIYQSALSRQDSTDRPYFWLYLDEFHHFITPSMERILSGTRKYGLGLTLAHQEFRQMQSRSQEVASSVLSNCYTRICFRLGDQDAEKFASGFSLFDAKALQNLGVGEAIVRVERADYDFNLSVPPVPLVAKETAKQRTRAVIDNSRALFSRRRTDVEVEISGSRPPEAAETKGKVPVTDDSLKTKASKAKGHKSSNKSFPQTPHEASNEHRYLQNLIKRIGEDNGFISTIEKEVFGGIGKIDVALERESIRIACEVADTNATSYEIENIQKCLSSGFNRVAVISTDTRHLENIRKRAELVLSPVHFYKVHFLEPENFHLLLESISLVHSADGTEPEKVKGYTVKTSVKESSPAEDTTKKSVIRDLLSRVMRRKKRSKDE